MEVPGMDLAARMRALAATQRDVRKRRARAVARSGTDDQVLVSEEARLIEKARRAEDGERQLKIARIKQEIDAGTYISTEKLHMAVSRMIDSVLHEDM